MGKISTRAIKQLFDKRKENEKRFDEIIKKISKDLNRSDKIFLNKVLKDAKFDFYFGNTIKLTKAEQRHNDKIRFNEC